nr:uncharacterized protein LOC117692197 [Crassostrea gigas]
MMQCCRVKMCLLSVMIMCPKEVFTFTGCQISTLTVDYVARCPKDAESWKMAAKQKDCESIDQECSKLNELNNQRYIFQYHCLINSWGNATVEVCALNRSIFGYCAEYDAAGGLVQDNYDLGCQQSHPPCPALYNSAEAYQYQYCFDLVYKKRANKITASQKESSSSSGRPSQSFLMICSSFAIAFHKQCTI